MANAVSLDWQMIGTILLGIAQLIALIGAYYGLKADNADLKAEFHLSMEKERSERLSLVSAAKAELVTMMAKTETYVNDLTHRVATLESGQDEWTKALRERTHQLANDVHTLVLKVDRLERPGHHADDKP